MDTGVVIGVDIGGTNIRVGAVDCNANIYQEKIFSSRNLQGDNAVNDLLDYLKTYIKSLRFTVRALSFGFPSTIDKDRMTVVNTPNLKGFNNVKIKPIYEDTLGLPVYINKDATALLYCDMYKQNIDQTGTVVGIYFGTGIGNSIIINGKEFTGNDGVACELGHIPVPGRDDPCSCGLNGCIELYAGGKMLERICEETFPNTPVELLFVEHSNTPRVQEYITNMANAVAIEINILNPGHVILGGGVIQMKSFPKALLKNIILEKTRRPIPRDRINILFSDGDDPYNGVVGAALYGFFVNKEAYL